MAFNYEVKDDTIVLTENGRTFFELKETEGENEVLIALSGKMRSEIEHVFYDELFSLVSVGVRIKLDFSKVTYLSDSCKHVLTAVQQTIDKYGKGEMRLRKIPEDILNDLRKDGYLWNLLIEE